MRWPWSGRAERPLAATAVVPARSEAWPPQGPAVGASLQSLTVTRPHEEWRQLGAAPTVVSPPLVARSTGFVQRLATRHVEEPTLRPLSHERALQAPAGLAVGVLRHASAAAAAPAVMPAPRRRTAIVQRRAGEGFAWPAHLPAGGKAGTHLDEAVETRLDPDVVTAESLRAPAPAAGTAAEAPVPSSTVLPIAAPITSRLPVVSGKSAPSGPGPGAAAPAPVSFSAAPFAFQLSRKLPVVRPLDIPARPASAELPAPRRLDNPDAFLASATSLLGDVSTPEAPAAPSATGPVTSVPAAAAAPETPPSADPVVPPTTAPLTGETPIQLSSKAPLGSQPPTEALSIRPRGLGEPMTALPRRLRGADAAAATASVPRPPTLQRSAAGLPGLPPPSAAPATGGIRSDDAPASVGPVPEPVQLLTVEAGNTALPLWQERTTSVGRARPAPAVTARPLVGANPLRPQAYSLGSPPVEPGLPPVPALPAVAQAAAPGVIARTVAGTVDLPSVATAGNLPALELPPVTVSRSSAPAGSDQRTVTRVPARASAGHPVHSESGSSVADIAAAAALFESIHVDGPAQGSRPGGTIGALLGPGGAGVTDAGSPSRPSGVRRAVAGAPLAALPLPGAESPGAESPGAAGAAPTAADPTTLFDHASANATATTTSTLGRPTGSQAAGPGLGPVQHAPAVQRSVGAPATSFEPTYSHAVAPVVPEIAGVQRALPPMPPPRALVAVAAPAAAQPAVQTISVEREAAPAAAEAAAATQPPTAAPTPPAPGPAELADQLYDHIAGRLRRDLLIERERSGLLLDR